MEKDVRRKPIAFPSYTVDPTTAELVITGYWYTTIEQIEKDRASVDFLEKYERFRIKFLAAILAVAGLGSYVLLS